MKEKEVTINIKKSSLKANPFRIVIDGKNYVLLPESEYIKMQDLIKLNREALIFKSLEKEILEEMPRDFDDVFVVAKTLIANMEKENLTIYDIKKIVKEIKLNYPNLFINIDEYFKDMHINS